MPYINERYIAAGQAKPTFYPMIKDSCNNGGQIYSVSAAESNRSTLIYGLVDVADGTKTYKTLQGSGVQQVACTKNERGHPVNIRLLWRYNDTNYIPNNLDNPWDVLLIQLFRNSTHRQLHNLHARQILVTIRKQNGQHESRQLGEESMWGDSIPLAPGWDIIDAAWGAPGT